MNVISTKKLPGDEPCSVNQIESPGDTRLDMNVMKAVDSEFRSAAPQQSSTQQVTNTVVDSEASRRVDLILSNPVIKNIRDQELGKMVLGISVPVTVAFTIYFFYQKSPPVIVSFVVVLLSIGCSAILNGLLLRDYFPLTATFLEVVGLAVVLLAVNGMVGSFLPSGLSWIGGIIGILTIAPFFIALLHSSFLLLTFDYTTDAD